MKKIVFRKHDKWKEKIVSKDVVLWLNPYINYERNESIFYIYIWKEKTVSKDVELWLNPHINYERNKSTFCLYI